MINRRSNPHKHGFHDFIRSDPVQHGFHDFSCVTDDTIIGVFKDFCSGIAVDADDGSAFLDAAGILGCSGDTDIDQQIRMDGVKIIPALSEYYMRR